MKKIILFSIVFMSLISIVNAQWQQTILDSESINCIAISGSNIFAGSNGNAGDAGVYLSTDNGNSWTAKGLTSCGANALAISGSNIFAGSGCGVYMSQNNGSSWVAVNNGLPAYSNITALAISGSYLFAGTYSGGVYFSTDNGSNWVAVNNGLPASIGVTALAISGINIFAGIYNHNTTNTGGTYLSSNNGQLWSVSDTCDGVEALAISGSNILAGFAGTHNGVLMSSNNGNSWASMNAGLTITDVYDLATKGDTIFAGTSGGVYFSTNNGSSSWSEVCSSVADTITCLSLAVNGSYIFAGTPYSGVWRMPLFSLGIEALKSNESNIVVYPNPVIRNLTIVAPQKAIIDILNVEGQSIKTFTITDSKKTIDLDGLSCGVYIIKATTDKGVVIKKFIKE